MTTTYFVVTIVMLLLVSLILWHRSVKHEEVLRALAADCQINWAFQKIIVDEWETCLQQLEHGSISMESARKRQKTAALVIAKDGIELSFQFIDKES